MFQSKCALPTARPVAFLFHYHCICAISYPKCSSCPFLYYFFFFNCFIVSCRWFWHRSIWGICFLFYVCATDVTNFFSPSVSRQAEGTGGDQELHNPVSGQRSLLDQHTCQQCPADAGHPGLPTPTHGVLHKPHLTGQKQHVKLKPLVSPLKQKSQFYLSTPFPIWYTMYYVHLALMYILYKWLCYWLRD